MQRPLQRTAAHFKLGIATISDEAPEPWYLYSSTWVLLAPHAELLQQLAIIAARQAPEQRMLCTVVWTDDYASLFSVLK